MPTEEHTSLLTNIVIQAATEAGIAKLPKMQHQARKSVLRRKLYQKRCRIYKTHSKNPLNPQLIEELAEIDRELKGLFQEQKSKEEAAAISKIKEDPRFFYKYANSKRKTKSRIGPLKTTKNGKPHIESGPKELAEILSAQYKSVFTKPKIENQVLDPKAFFLNIDNPDMKISTISDIDFSIGDITQALNELNPDSSAGPDGWPSYLLHHYRDIFAPHLHMIWRKSLDTGQMPEGINVAFITPIFKGGEKCEPGDYRPIALTSHLTKVFERVVRKEIIRHLAANHLLNSTQHGFVSKRSCLTQLVEYYSNILNLLEKHGTVDAIYLDFAKAFDKCDHGVILHKLRHFGITGKLGIWLHSFLTKRQQAVCVMGEKSAKEWVTSGVPQGSVLGPLLFSILISDINSGVSVSMLLSYADDTKVFTGISNSSSETCLQDDLQGIYKWAETNNQEFNEKKFESVRFTALASGLNSYLNPHAIPIKNNTIVKDLGVFFSNDCKFDFHISTIVTKANKLCGWTLRTFDARDRLTMVTLLKSLILPTIEYCSPLWSPTDQNNIQKLERTQRAFTKKIAGLEELSYEDRLKSLKIYSLERRRERYIILYIWKVLHGYYPDPGFNISSYNEWDHSITLTVPILKTPPPDKGGATLKKLQERDILYHGAKLFNALPRHLRKLHTGEEASMTPIIYKSHLDKYLSLIPEEPTTPRAAVTNSLIHQIPLYQRNKHT